MGRAPCCDEDGIKKGPWTPEEDQMLVDYIQKYGHGSWRALPRLAGLKRCGKSCRLRWTNYLRPGIKRGRFTDEEDQTIIKLHSHLGNKWSAIAARLPGRTDNEIKNYWNTHLRKKLLRMGIDPATHKPRADLNLLGNITHLLAASNLYNLMSPWDAAQLARTQLLQTLLSAMTSNVSPIMEAINLMQQPTFNHYHFTEQLQSNCQSEGLLGGSLPHNLTPTHSNFSNPGIQPLPYQYQALEEPYVSLEAQQTAAAVNESGYTTPDFYIYNNNSSSSRNSNEHMGFPCAILPAIPTPPLVASSPELASVDSLLDQINPTEFSTHSSTSTTFDPWGELDLDNQESDCGWADIDVDI